MSVTLTDEQYGAVLRTLSRIACGRRPPNNRRLCRDDLVTLAREACDVLGWPYGVADIFPDANRPRTGIAYE